MKKTIFLLLLAIIATSTFAQTNFANLIAQRNDYFENNTWKGVDSVEYYFDNNGKKTGMLLKSNDATNNWNNILRYTYTLTNSNKIASELREIWNNGTWVNNVKDIYTYDANDNKTQVLHDVWNGSQWNSTGKIDYSGYDTFGNYFQVIQTAYSGGNWVNVYKNENTYVTGANKLETKSTFNWNNLNNNWDKTEKLTYNYTQDSVTMLTRLIKDSLNNWMIDTRHLYSYNTNTPIQLTEDKTQKWDTTLNPSAWVNSKHVLYYYNTSNNKIDHTLSEDAVGLNWSATYQSQYVYDANDSLQEFYNQWYINGVWENYKRNVYTYTNGHKTEDLFYVGSGNTWNNSTKTNYTFDSKNQQTYRQIDSFINGSFVADRRDFYWYSQFPLNVTNNNLALENVTIYPNPCENYLNINFNANENFTAQIFVKDVLGKTKIISLQPIFKGQNNWTTHTENLVAGNYFIEIHNTKTNQSQLLKFQVTK